MRQRLGNGRFSLIVILLLLAVPLGWLLRGVIGQFVVNPAAAGVWLLRNLLRMAPQAELWTGLLLIAVLNLVVIVLSGAGDGRFRWRPVKTAGPPVRKNGRVGTWHGALRMGQRARRLIIRPLRLLVVQIIAHAQHQSEDVARAALGGQSLPIPDHLQTYLNDRAARPRSRPFSVALESATTPPLDPEVVELVETLETLLEVPHDT